MSSADAEQSPSLYDYSPQVEDFRRDVIEGLSQPQKSLPCKYFYDERGSRLFEEICKLDEYYPTRTELGIMKEWGTEMADILGRGCLLIEYGSGSSLKTRVLLDHLVEPAGYVPIDISCDHLLPTADGLRKEYPDIPVLPVCADYTADEYELPPCPNTILRKVVYFPGSTIGNFDRDFAEKFLRRIADLCGPDGILLIGVDLKKDEGVLEAAYDDAQGTTAAFNRNILHRINGELEGDFNVENFKHRAYYNGELGRIEMYLVSTEAQTVSIGDESISFDKGESIHTENSHKYSPEEFKNLARRSGFIVHRVWTDPDELFSVQCLFVKT